MMENLKRSRHYEHNGKAPGPQKPPASPEDDGRMLCPMSRKPCLQARCMVWNEQWRNCMMNPVSLYNEMRDALTDALVDMQRAYQGKEYKW